MFNTITYTVLEEQYVSRGLWAHVHVPLAIVICGIYNRFHLVTLTKYVVNITVVKMQQIEFEWWFYELNNC